MTEREALSLDNSGLVNYIKSLPDNTGNPGRVYLGSNDDKSKTYYPVLWENLKERLLKFLRLKNEIHVRYYKTNLFPFEHDIEEEINLKQCQVLTRKGTNSIYVYVSYGSCRWIYMEKILISEFCDIPSFKEKYSKQLRTKRLRTVNDSVNNLMDKLGKLLEEQQRLKEEEGD